MLKGVQHCLRIVVFLFATSLSVAGDLTQAAVDLILPADTPNLQSLAHGIQQKANFPINTYISQLPPAEQAGDILLIISDELLHLLDNNPPYRARFAMYINSARFAAYRTGSNSAVYADQPLSRQLKLINTLIGNRHADIAMAWKHPEYRMQYDALTALYPEYRFESQEAANSPERQINRLIQQSDVLLATPETELYNANSIRSILLAAYRHNTLVIGPNKAFVTAGALASVNSEPEHYIDDIVDSIQHYIDTGEIPQPRYPSKFNVSINHHVAESLGIPIHSETDLLQQIRQN